MVKRFDFADCCDHPGMVPSVDGRYIRHEDYAALLAKLEIAKKALNDIEVNGDDESFAIAWDALCAIKDPVDVPTGTQDLIPGYQERCEHGVRWENYCATCNPIAIALMGNSDLADNDHGFELYP